MPDSATIGASFSQQGNPLIGGADTGISIDYSPFKQLTSFINAREFYGWKQRQDNAKEFANQYATDVDKFDLSAIDPTIRGLLTDDFNKMVSEYSELARSENIDDDPNQQLEFQRKRQEITQGFKDKYRNAVKKTLEYKSYQDFIHQAYGVSKGTGKGTTKATSVTGVTGADNSMNRAAEAQLELLRKNMIDTGLDGELDYIVPYIPEGLDIPKAKGTDVLYSDGFTQYTGTIFDPNKEQGAASALRMGISSLGKSSGSAIQDKINSVTTSKMGLWNNVMGAFNEVRKQDKYWNVDADGKRTFNENRFLNEAPEDVKNMYLNAKDYNRYLDDKDDSIATMGLRGYKRGYFRDKKIALDNPDDIDLSMVAIFGNWRDTIGKPQRSMEVVDRATVSLRGQQAATERAKQGKLAAEARKVTKSTESLQPDLTQIKESMDDIADVFVSQKKAVSVDQFSDRERFALGMMSVDKDGNPQVAYNYVDYNNDGSFTVYNLGKDGKKKDAKVVRSSDVLSSISSDILRLDKNIPVGTQRAIETPFAEDGDVSKYMDKKINAKVDKSKPISILDALNGTFK